MKRGHLSVSDVLAFRIGSAIELAPHSQPGRRARGADEIDDHRETHEGLPAPVAADVGKEPMLDLVRFAGPGREVTDGDRQAVRLASRCNSHFHRRTRGPLLPPASAVMSNERARW